MILDEADAMTQDAQNALRRGELIGMLFFGRNSVGTIYCIVSNIDYSGLHCCIVLFHDILISIILLSIIS